MRRDTSNTRSKARKVAAVLALAVAGSLPALPAPASPQSPCGPRVAETTADGRPVCAHPDQAPPGVDLNELPSTDHLKERRYGQSKKPSTAPYTASGTTYTAAANAIACVGDGTTGTRVQAIYARASDVLDRYSSVVGLIAQYAADADYELNTSAALSGTGRRIRYVTDSCALDVEHVTLSSSGDNSFTATRNELRAMGYNRNDRKYLVWVDAAVGICGIAEMYPDDRDTSSNWSNGGNMFARVDAPCWGYAEAHELLHNLGAVQDSAPHSTNAGHCYDENDTMCYNDGGGFPMVSVCPTLASWHVDCNLDDYFNAAPAPGSYLDTHWNSADSVFLEGAAPLPPAPTIAVSAPSSFYAGTTVNVSATVAVPEGRTFTIAWSTTRSDCKFTVASGATSQFYCPATATGSGQITATVVDSLGLRASASKTFTLKKGWGKRTVTAGVSRSLKTINKGGTSTLTVKAIDALTGKPIAGLRVTIWYRRAGSTTWKKITTKTTKVNGTFTYTVSPPKSTYYRVITEKNATWASDKSKSKKVGVV